MAKKPSRRRAVRRGAPKTAPSDLKTITLPSSKAKIRFATDFDREKLARLTRELCVNDRLAAEVRANPTKALADVGILIADEDRRLINDEDLLFAMGHRAPRGAASLAIGPLVVVLVAVAVVNFPDPAY